MSNVIPLYTPNLHDRDTGEPRSLAEHKRMAAILAERLSWVCDDDPVLIDQFRQQVEKILTTP